MNTKKAVYMKFDKEKVDTHKIRNQDAKEIVDEFENIFEQSNNWFKVAMFGKRMR